MSLLDAILMDDDDWTPKRDRRGGIGHNGNENDNRNRNGADPLDTSIDLDFND